MQLGSIQWDEVPNIITKEQLCKLCHISKATALYLLQSGKLPCEFSGKQTRCYKIYKEDVIAYIADRERYPENYTVPKGWYGGRRRLQQQMELPPFVIGEMAAFYQELLASYPDVLTGSEVSVLTGYCKSAVNGWCRKGYLKSFQKRSVNHIPKVYLTEFFCSQHFRTIPQKSDWHNKILKQFARWQRRRELRGVIDHA